jgi:hypothetical protein
MKIGDVYRCARPYKSTPEVIDGLPNYFFVTHTEECNRPLLDKGINPIGWVNAVGGKRRPAILIRSSPHKIGSHDTPWQDTFDADNGHIRYYGDNKDPGKGPSDAPGNKALLEAFRQHSSLDLDIRKHSVPVIFFRSVTRKGKAKGFVEFQGFGVIRGVELVTQYDRAKHRSFSNYAFDFAVLSLDENHEEFDWQWISNRRDPNLTLEKTLKNAPESWKSWIKAGPSSIDRYRRRVSKLMTKTTKEQLPKKSSNEYKTLQKIYEFYKSRKHRFESLAELVVERVIAGSGGNYKRGWITPHLLTVVLIL